MVQGRAAERTARSLLRLGGHGLLRSEGRDGDYGDTVRTFVCIAIVDDNAEGCRFSTPVRIHP